MRVQAVWHRYFLFLSLAMIALAGGTAGWLSAVILGLRLTPAVATGGPARTAKVETAARRPLKDYQIILDRDIFDSEDQGGGVLAETAPVVTASSAASQPAAPSASKTHLNLTLIGTVTAGPDSLAVIAKGKETGVYRLKEKIGDAVLEEIARNHVILRHRDGSRETLAVTESSPGSVAAETHREAAPKAAKSKSKSGIKEVGENRWLIPKETAERARGNINDLLKQARLEPRIVDGQTKGFVVRMIRPGSFLALLGLSLNDVVMEINNVELNSPERALQIMQQLREARHISVSLLRNNKPVTFEYEID